MAKIEIDSRVYRLSGLAPILGSLPGNKDVFLKRVAQKAPDQSIAAAEASFVDGADDRITVFARDPKGRVCVMGYQIKGYFKSAFGALRGQYNLTGHKSKVDQLVFVEPRLIPLKRGDQPLIYEDSINERPLRGATAMGERMALAASEQVDDPWHIDIEVSLMPSKAAAKGEALCWDAIELALDYGAYHGLGQWRNAGYGRFTWERTED